MSVDFRSLNCPLLLPLGHNMRWPILVSRPRSQLTIIAWDVMFKCYLKFTNLKSKANLAGGMPGTANSGLTVCPVLVRSNTEGPSGHQERLYRLKDTKVVHTNLADRNRWLSWWVQPCQVENHIPVRGSHSWQSETCATTVLDKPRHLENTGEWHSRFSYIRALRIVGLLYMMPHHITLN